MPEQTPDTEARLVAVGRAGTAAHVERIVRAWRRVDRPGAAREAAGRHVRRSLQVYPDEDARLDNLALLCRRHHRAVHEEGYGVARDADGTLRFSTPEGRPIPEVPAPPAVPPDAGQALGSRPIGRAAWRSTRGRAARASVPSQRFDDKTERRWRGSHRPSWSR